MYEPRPRLDFGTGTQANAANFDGSIIVGSTSAARPSRWTAATGMQNLPLPVTITSGSALAIPSDGSVIVGTGTFNGESRSYLITVPTPSTLALFALPTALACTRRRRPY